MKKLWMLALPLVACAFAGCSDDDDEPQDPNQGGGTETPVPPVEYETITFEDCEYPEGKLSNFEDQTGDFEYTEHGATFKVNKYYGYATGAGVSSKALISESGSPKSGCVALAADTEHPGASGSDKFCYIGWTKSYAAKSPQGFQFEEGVERSIVSLEIMNSTEMYQYAKYGYYSKPALPEGGNVTATFTGYNAEGEETGNVAVLLADYSSEELALISEWTEVNLESLGKINKLAVAITWSDEWTPGYGSSSSVCLDNIKFIKE